jgi:GNAT superfamily N-acetyltransferase
MSSTFVRTLTNDDFEPVYDIFLSVFPSKYVNEFEDAWNTRNTRLTFGAFSADEGLIGFVLTAQKDYGEQRVEFLAVHPRVQKGGVGTLLLQKILDYCLRTKSRASLIPVNDPRIIHWYKKHGFKDVGDPFISKYTGDLEQVMEFAS